jgi:hypothetical protein
MATVFTAQTLHTLTLATSASRSSEQGEQPLLNCLTDGSVDIMFNIPKFFQGRKSQPTNERLFRNAFLFQNPFAQIFDMWL